MKPEWYKVLGRGMHPILMIDTLVRGLNERIKEVVGFEFNHKYYLRYDGATYFEKNEWDKLKQLFKEQAAKDPDFYFKLVEKRLQMDKEMIEFSQRIADMDVNKLSLVELKKLFIKFIDKDMPRVGSVYIPFNLEEVFEDIIKEELRKKVSEDKVEEYFSSLTTCPKETYSNKEKIKLLELAVDIKRNGLNTDKINEHSQDFIWLNQYFYISDPYTPEKVIERLNKIEDPLQELEKLKSKSVKKEERFNQIVNELNLSPRIVKIARAAQEHSNGRDNLIGSSAKVYYNCLPFFNEIAKRIGINYETLIELRINDVLFFLDKLIEIKKIKEGYGIYLNNGNIDIYTGKDIEKIKVKGENTEGINSVEGQVANKGYAKGRVKIFLSAYDKKDMQHGDILVSPMTTPNLSLFMEKAGAIVTEEGGLTCHAAIIAREMDKPCIIGTKIACSVFKDGDLVEVDANKGIVKKL